MQDGQVTFQSFYHSFLQQYHYALNFWIPIPDTYLLEQSEVSPFSSKLNPQLKSFASFALVFFQTPVLTLSEASEMMEPQAVQLLRSVALFLSLSVRSVVGPQMVASPKLEALRQRWRDGCCSWGEGCASKDMWTLLEGDAYEISRYSNLTLLNLGSYLEPSWKCCCSCP